MYFNVETILRGYHTYQSVWVDVGKKLPCQRERANSKDPFTVAVTTGELIIGCKKFLLFTQCFYNKMGQFSTELLDLQLNDNVLNFLNLLSARIFLEEEIFTGRNFRKLVFNCENQDNFCLTKISRYMWYLPWLRSHSLS